MAGATKRVDHCDDGMGNHPMSPNCLSCRTATTCRRIQTPNACPTRGDKSEVKHQTMSGKGGARPHNGPSTTGGKSGGGRGNNPPGGK